MAKQNNKKDNKKVKENNKLSFIKNPIVKNILIGLLVVLGLVGLFFVSENVGDRSMDKDKTNISNNDTNNTNSSSSDESEEENPLINDGESWTEEEEAELEEISFSEFKKVLKKKELTIIMFGSDGCYWCVNQKPVLKHAMYLNPEVNVKLIDVSKMTSSDSEYLADLHESLASFGTPTFIAVKDGKVTSVETGGRDLKGVEEMFKNMGAI